MLKLYHWEPNAESLKLMVTLREKNLPYESHYVDLINLDHHGEAYQALAGQTRGPLLVEDGEPMGDSQLALEYLAEGYLPRLAPVDPEGWYDVQAWTAWLDQTFAGNVRLLGWHTVTLPAMSEAERRDFLDRSAKVPQPSVMAGWAQVTSDAEASEDQLANARERIGQGVDRIEKTLADSDWLLAGAYSVVDINAFALTHTLPRLLPDVVNAAMTPKMMAWLKRIGERKAVKDALATGKSPGVDVYAPGV